jgi:hypothetical protein
MKNLVRRQFTAATIALLAVACGSVKVPGRNGAGGDAGTSADEQAGSAGDAARIVRRICDGSSDIRFAFAYMSTGSVQTFTDELYELGVDFLYVDGTCHYWVREPSFRQDEYRYWRGYREGTLAEDEERQLHDLVGYDEVAPNGPLARACSGTFGMFDAPVARLWDGEHVQGCNGNPDLSPDWPLRDQFYDEGSPLAGPMRIEVGLDAVPTVYKHVYEWPLSRPPNDYWSDYDAPKSIGVTDPEEADALRRLRDQAFADFEANPNSFFGLIITEPPNFVPPMPGQTVDMSMRDELPFTDENGQWSPP